MMHHPRKPWFWHIAQVQSVRSSMSLLLSKKPIRRCCFHRNPITARVYYYQRYYDLISRETYNAIVSHRAVQNVFLQWQ